PEIADLAEKYDAEFEEGILTVMDDSHGVGAVGETGRGTTELTNDNRLDILIATLGMKGNIGNKVAVVGGGNVAIDVSRTALRLGAKEVTIAYRRTRAEMPASAEEISEALKEGVKMLYLTAPVKVISVNSKLKVEFIWMELGGVDTRGVRWPGLISYVTPPGGGTTDYAVEIYYEAIKHRKYLDCFIKEGTYLDMMYMPDAIKSAIDIMEADPSKLKYRNAYNVTAMSFAPEHIANEIKKHIPDFIIEYKVDPVRQAIAESWPDRMDDSAAREEWGWNPKYDLATMTKDMLEKLSAKLKIKT
ncbi:unnamed protein product, partial [marine sediment metagenome]